MMTLDFVAVRPEWTVREALDHIREHGYDRETLNMVYVADETGRLVDDVRVRRFLLSPPEQPVRELLDGHHTALGPADDRETALGLFKKFDRVALPVVDDTRKLIGIVTVDDMLDVAEAEATEDIQKLGGSEALEEPYTTIALHKMVKKRASWLVVLFLGEMLTATAMSYFEDEIAKAVVLALFVPLVISSGGNAGSQAATLVIRALALGEFRLRDWWRVMRRELAAGLALGLILGAVGFLRIALWSMFSDLYGPHWPLVAVTVGVSLVGVVLWGSLVGSMLPLALKRLGFDPATSSAPFVATLVDVTGLVIYFTVAYVFMRGVLL
jgi:magnesium transporter